MSTCMLKGVGRRRGQLLLEGLTLWGIGWQGLDVVDRTWGTVVISGHQRSSEVISGHQRYDRPWGTWPQIRWEVPN